MSKSRLRLWTKSIKLLNTIPIGLRDALKKIAELVHLIISKKRPGDHFPKYFAVLVLP
jgi:hypothetical protein